MPKDWIINSSEGELICVQQPRKLKQLAKLGFIEYPTKWGGSCQVAEGEKNVTHFEHYENSFRLSLKYVIKYIDGSIYPYLFCVKPKYGATYEYGYHY